MMFSEIQQYRNQTLRLLMNVLESVKMVKIPVVRIRKITTTKNKFVEKK